MDTSTALIIYTSNGFKKKCDKISGFRYLECEDSDNVFYYILEKNNNIIGVLKEKLINGYIYENYVIENMLTIMYITINENYKNKGYSKDLLEKYFKYRNNCKIYLSPYSKDGYKYLRKNIYEIALKNNVEIISKEYCYEY